MLTLVYKDFIVQRSVILVYLASVVLFTSPMIAVSVPIVNVTVLAMTFAFATAAQDDRANSHILLNSLPVTRREIVTAKYLFHLAISLSMLLVTVVCEVVFDGPSLRAALSEAWIATMVLAWFFAAFFPMYYGLGWRFVQVGMIVFFVLLMTVAPIVYNLGVRHDFWGLPEMVASLPRLPLYLFVTGITLAALAGSWRTSVWLYRCKKL